MKAGIIGTGHGSRVLFHAFELSNIKVYGISSKHFNKSEKIRKKLNILKAYKHWSDLVEDKNIEIVAIAVPPNLQLEIIKKCIKFKKKIFAEKPLSIEYLESKKIINKLNKYNNHFIMDYIFPEHLLFKKFERFVKKINKDNDNFIEIFFYNKSYVIKNNISNWKTNDNFGGGLVNLYLPHIIDYLILYFGEINKIQKIYNKQAHSMTLLVLFKKNYKVIIKINANSKKQIHFIKLQNNSHNITLCNKRKDYAKNFELKFETKKTKKTKLFLDENLKNFNKDSRIYLTHILINNFKKKFNRDIYSKLLNRYLIVEKWVDKIRNI